MTHQIYRVTKCEVVGAHTLKLQFDDGLSRTINFEPVLASEIFAPLKELSVFNAVRIDPEVHTLVWPNGADFDPATLHDWPAHEAELRERARSWEAIRK